MKASRLIIIVAALVLAGALAVFLNSLRPDTITIVVPTRDIGAYQVLNPQADLKEVQVAEGDDEQLTGNELTLDYFNAQYKKHEKVVFFTNAVRSNERIDRRKLAGASAGSLSVVVAPDERVVSVSASVIGAVAGIIQPGDVVSVVGGGGSTLADYAKVISIGVGSEAGQGVTGQTGGSGEDENEQRATGTSNLTLLLAVPRDEAEAIANDNQGVSLVYNPFCKVTANGAIEPVDKDGAEQACPETSGGDTPAEGTETDTPDAEDATDEGVDTDAETDADTEAVEETTTP